MLGVGLYEEEHGALVGGFFGEVGEGGDGDAHGDAQGEPPPAGEAGGEEGPEVEGAFLGFVYVAGFVQGAVRLEENYGCFVWSVTLSGFLWFVGCCRGFAPPSVFFSPFRAILGGCHTMVGVLRFFFRWFVAMSILGGGWAGRGLLVAEADADERGEEGGYGYPEGG